MFVITNMTNHKLVIDGVSLNSKEQLSIAVPSEQMLAAQKLGTLRILSSDETLEERKADTAAINEGISKMDRIIR